MINLTSPCCGVTAKYADANSSKYGCAGCGSGFTIEQAKVATDAAAPAAPVVEPAAPIVEQQAEVAPVADAPATDAAPAADTPAAQ